MNYDYIIAMILLCVIYASGIFAMKYIRNFKLFNYLFMAMVYIPYLWVCHTVYKSVGFYDWNFQNVLPVANVSPFMFSMMPILLILPKKAREYVYLLISLLTVGMFLSSILGCIYNASINYRFHFHFLLDYISHFVLSFFGIYLIRTKQTKLTVKNALISSSIIFGAATVMLILNLIFDKAFFGLSLRGKHNIYNNVLVDNSYLSALLYYVGLAGVLALGFAVCALFNKQRFAIKKNNEGSDEEAKAVETV
jgi:hypothetical protein